MQTKLTIPGFQHLMDKYDLAVGTYAKISFVLTE